MVAGDALIFMNEIGYPWQSALDLLQLNVLPELPSYCVIMDGPAETTAGGYDAAAVTFTGETEMGARGWEQIVVVQGPERNIAISFSSVGEGLAADYANFTAVLDSLEIYPPPPGPGLIDGGAPAGYVTRAEEVLGLEMSIPPDWIEVPQADGVLVLQSPPGTAYATLLVQDASDLAEVVASGDTEMLFWAAQEASWPLALPGTQLVSDLVTHIDAQGQEMGLMRVSLPERGPGITAVFRRGDRMLLAVAAAEDFAAYEETLLRILSSIRLVEEPLQTRG
jgi:hypothetical protein